MTKADVQSGGSNQAVTSKDGGKNGPPFMDVVDGELDAAGLWPGVGIVPDLLNAGLYAICNQRGW